MTDRTAYQAAGVDVEAGDRAVALMADAVRATWGGTVVGSFGGFAASVALPVGLREPLLVSSSDGVGTKTAIAVALDRYDTIGVDLVAMVVDDVVCSGAVPLFLQDYIAVGRLEPTLVAAIVGGVAAGCREASVALVGGETAEHPGLIEVGGFDLAGFAVGVVERDDLIDGSTIEAGDAIVGIPSSGLHANGFSLVRALVDDGRLALADDLLTPTRIFAPHMLELRRILRRSGNDLRGIAHITGGGLPGNVPRCLPETVAATIDPSTWEMPAQQRHLGTLAGMDDSEIRATFNGGIGMVMVVAPEAVAMVRAAIRDAVVIGRVVPIGEAGSARYLESPIA